MTFDINDLADLSRAIFTFCKGIDAAGALAGVAEIETDGSLHKLSIEILYDPELHSTGAIDKANREARDRCDGSKFKCGQDGCDKCDGIPF